jgi:hypothetical protein
MRLCKVFMSLINEVCQHTFSIFSIFDLGIREGD